MGRAPAASGRYLILELNPDDDGALLTVKKGRPAKQSKNDPAKNGPGKVGDKNDSAPTLKPATAEIQIGATPSKPGTSPISSSTTSNHTNTPTPPPAKPCATTCSRRKTPLPARVTRWCSLCTTRA